MFRVAGATLRSRRHEKRIPRETVIQAVPRIASRPPVGATLQARDQTITADNKRRRRPTGYHEATSQGGAERNQPGERSMFGERNIRRSRNVSAAPYPQQVPSFWRRDQRATKAALAAQNRPRGPQDCHCRGAITVQRCLPGSLSAEAPRMSPTVAVRRAKRNIAGTAGWSSSGS